MFRHCPAPIIVSLLTVIFAFVLILSLRTPSSLPHPLFDAAFSPTGIGISISPSTLSISTSFLPPDHTEPVIQTLASLPADHALADVLHRLDLNSSKHLAPPYLSPFERALDLPRVSLRKLRKSLGLPATPEIGIVADCTRPIIAAGQRELGRKIVSALITLPPARAFYADDMADLYDYLGILELPNNYGEPGLAPDEFRVPLHTSSTWVAYGHGTKGTNGTYAAAARDLDRRSYVSLGFEDDALLFGLSHMRESGWIAGSPGHIAWEFAWSNRDAHDGGREGFWGDLFMMVDPVFWRPGVDCVGVYGSRARERDVLNFIDMVLKHFGRDNGLEVHREFPEALPSRGAAEMARIISLMMAREQQGGKRRRNVGGLRDGDDGEWL